VQWRTAGPVELEPKTLWRDGTTHRVMSLLAFMQRLAALVPQPIAVSALRGARPGKKLGGCSVGGLGGGTAHRRRATKPKPWADHEQRPAHNTNKKAG